MKRGTLLSGAAALVGLSALFSSTDGRAGPPTPTTPLTLELSESKRVRVMLPSMPPTRTRCSFDAEDGTDSVTFEWDPLSPRGLAREATLLGKKYRVSCATEAARHAIQHETNYAWTYHAATSEITGGNGKLRFCDPAVSGVAKLCETNEAKTIATLEVLDRRSLSGDDARVDFASTPGLPLLGPAPRAFGALSDEALNEAFQVIAEVVVEQAKSKGMKLVTAKLTKLLCETLVLDDAERSPALPRTCDAVRSLRLEDLTSTGRQLLDAFVEDLARATLGPMLDKCSSTIGRSCDSLVPAVNVALDAAVSAALGREEKLRSAGHRVLLALMKVMANSSRPELHLAARVIQECSASPCDAARIQRMLDRPGDYFTLAEPQNGAWTVPAGAGSAVTKAFDAWKNAGASDKAKKADELLRALIGEWASMGTFISSALRIASPSATVTETAQLTAALDLLFDVVERVADVKQGTYATRGKADEVQSPKDSAEWIALARRALLAAVERDIGKLAVPATRMLKGLLPGAQNWDLRVVARLGGALGSFMSTSVTGRAPTKEEMEERRKAKKEAVKSLIESQTERRLRLGDGILSLGSSVGFFGGGHEGGTFPGAKPEDPPIAVGERFHAQPVVTLGLAFDYHCRNLLGFHVELAPVNLGSYATVLSGSPNGDAVAPPSPGDALSPSVTIGLTYLFTEADLIFLVGAQAGYSAKVGDPARTGAETPNANSYRGFYLGGMVGAYIPLLDFN